MPTLHPMAIIDPQAQLADDVVIGAYAIIKGHVTLGPGCVVHEHTHIHGRTVIGPNCKLGPTSFVGLDPQHLKYQGEPTELHVGEGTIVRELAVIHRATHPGAEQATRLGARCFVMSGVHIAHDCQIGNDAILASGAALAGHCQIGDRVFIGGLSGIHQWVRIGRLTVMAGHSATARDIPPFAAVLNRSLKGYNAIGCKRAGIAPSSLVAIRAAYRCIHVTRSTRDTVKAIQDKVPLVPEVQEIIDFIATSQRGILPSIHYMSELQNFE